MTMTLLSTKNFTTILKATMLAVCLCLAPFASMAQKKIITRTTTTKHNPTPKPRPNPTPKPRPKPSTMSATEKRQLVDNLMDNMVYVEGGVFTMGGTEPVEEDKSASKDHPQHQVTLSSFNIGKYEITQGEWMAVMGKNPSKVKGNNLPVTNLKWEDCQKFISKLNALTGRNFRLPTEAEWEYAARGGKMNHSYKYAGSNDLDDVAWYKYNSNGKPHAVGQKQPNELGLYDMTGNASEWCEDVIYMYVPWPTVDPLGYFGDLHVYRGGNFDSGSDKIYVAFRNYEAFEENVPMLGLRLVESPNGKNPRFQVWENWGTLDFVGYVGSDGHRTEGTYHYKGNKKNADGTFYDGSVYEGTLQKYYWPDNSAVTDTYDHGKYTYKDGTVYEGYFDVNKNMTKGKMTWKSGDYFEGEWRNNQRYYGKYYKAKSHKTFTGYFDSQGNYGEGKWE